MDDAKTSQESLEGASEESSVDPSTEQTDSDDVKATSQS